MKHCGRDKSMKESWAFLTVKVFQRASNTSPGTGSCFSARSLAKIEVIEELEARACSSRFNSSIDGPGGEEQRELQKSKI